MKIKLLGWESRGLRCPDAAIDLTVAPRTAAQISLLQMPNGTGKTTTLKMLDAAMSGRAVQWDEETIRGLRRPGEDHAKGVFVVRLSVDDRPLTFELSLDFERAEAIYRTTRAGSNGVVPGWDPEPTYRRFLTPRFLDLFVFDGEFANRLFDPSGLQAETVIDALCELYLLDEVSRFAEGVWNKQAKLAPGKSDATLQKEQLRYEALTKRHGYVTRKREDAASKAVTLQAEIETLERKIRVRLSEVEATRDEAHDAELALVSANSALERIVAETIGALRNPLALHAQFAETLWTLRGNLDRLKLPENTSAQFFLDLVEDDECICGREMTDGAVAEIERRSADYLDDMSTGFLNALKQDIEKAGVPSETAAIRTTFAASITDLAAARRQRKEAQQVVDLLTTQLADAGDDELKGWQTQKDLAAQRLEGAKELLRKADEPDDLTDDVETWSIQSLDRQIEEVGKKIATITQTLDLRAKTEVLKQILGRAGELARAQIKSELIEISNDRLRQVLMNDPLRIASIDGALRLAGQGGASVGQTLSVGYVFLMSVLQRGGHELPLIVDSPANPIDAGVRRRIGALIPQLCSQFVGFTINTEREGFVPALQEASDSIKYLTLFRRTEGTRGLQAGLPNDGVSITDNAVLVDGRDFFERFDLEDEG